MEWRNKFSSALGVLKSYCQKSRPSAPSVIVKTKIIFFVFSLENLIMACRKSELGMYFYDGQARNYLTITGLTVTVFSQKVEAKNAGL